MLTTMTVCSSQREWMAGLAQLAELFEVSVATTKSGGLTISVQTSHNIHCALIGASC